MISFSPLWSYLRRYGLNRTYLYRCVSGCTLAKLGKNENVDISTINKICECLECQPSDIMLWKSDKK